jgi:hypothetical protein
MKIMLNSTVRTAILQLVMVGGVRSVNVDMVLLAGVGFHGHQQFMLLGVVGNQVGKQLSNGLEE